MVSMDLLGIGFIGEVVKMQEHRTTKISREKRAEMQKLNKQQIE